MTHPITSYREQHGLTLEAFAALVGGETNKSVVLKWERGVMPRHASLLRIEQATGGIVTPEALLSASLKASATEAA